MEVVLNTKRRKINYVHIHITNYVATSKAGIKYLEVIVDAEFSYRQHVQ